MTYPNPTLIALLASGRRELTTTPTEDTAVIDADAPADPIPAEGAPHAYIAVLRTFSPHADRPEWDDWSVVIPEWDHEQLERWRRRPSYTLLPIGPDGDTGTRAIVDPRVIETPEALDALPDRTVVHRGDVIWQLADRDYGDPGEPIWQGLYGMSATAAEVLAGGPVTVLHAPAEVTA